MKLNLIVGLLDGQYTNVRGRPGVENPILGICFEFHKQLRFMMDKPSSRTRQRTTGNGPSTVGLRDPKEAGAGQIVYARVRRDGGL